MARAARRRARWCSRARSGCPALRHVMPGDLEHAGVKGAELLEERRAHVCSHVQTRCQHSVKQPESGEQNERTEVARAAARALIANLAVSDFPIGCVLDFHVLRRKSKKLWGQCYERLTDLFAVPARAIDLGRDGHYLVAIDVVLAARAEANVEPCAL